MEVIEHMSSIDSLVVHLQSRAMRIHSTLDTLEDYSALGVANCRRSWRPVLSVRAELPQPLQGNSDFSFVSSSPLVISIMQEPGNVPVLDKVPGYNLFIGG